MAELMKKDRELVIPGDEIIKSMDYLPGKNCFREGNSIYAKKLGLVSVNRRVISVIPLSGVYIPKAGDMVLGEVIDIQSNGWVIDIKSVNEAFLPLSGVREFIDTSKTDLSKVYGMGDVVYAKISGANSTSVYLTMQDTRSRKMRSGRVVKMSPAKVPRLIGKEGSMINLIKNKTKCRISIGQNGLVWFEGEEENKVIDAIRLIERESVVDGLTDKVSKLLG
ncbi:MAG: RNA-binding protein [Candidatus Aenigmatarchaeota archaeon]|nr:MAG: RNA-binding protein [Candidatus Aenigmarchaeota archaeon]